MPIRSRLTKVAILPFFAALFGLAACAQSPVEDGTDTAAASSADGGAELDPIPVMGEEVRIVAFGDSLFAGYGFADRKKDGYPAKLEAALRARGINARVIDAAVSGDTTGAGQQRLAFTLDELEEKPDLFVLELGGNDFLRRLPPAEARTNLTAIMDELKKREIPTLIMGMRAPPNLGPEYVTAFDAIYGDLAKSYGAQLIPFWMEAIYEKPALFQGDRIHPTVEGIEELVAATVGEVAAALPESKPANDN